jgi:ATP-binding cassette, subfamily C (CFTR/MRP), member 1
MPCAVLWLVAPLWIYMLTRQSEGKIRISWILISKSIVTILLISIETIHIIRAYNRNEHLLVYFLTPYILIMTYILVLFLIHFERIRNLKSSTLVFIFFGLLTLDSIVTLRSKIIHYFNHKSHDVFGLYLFIAFFVLICLNTILTLFSEQDVANYEQVINKDDTSSSSSSRLKKMPENNVSLMSKLWFWWINDLIKTGFKRDLIRDDLWEIDDSETSIVITKRLENAWNEKANDYINKIREHPELEKPVKIKPPKENKKLKKENYKNGNKSEEEIKLNVNSF